MINTSKFVLGFRIQHSVRVLRACSGTSQVYTNDCDAPIYLFVCHGKKKKGKENPWLGRDCCLFVCFACASVAVLVAQTRIQSPSLPFVCLAKTCAFFSPFSPIHWTHVHSQIKFAMNARQGKKGEWIASAVSSNERWCCCCSVGF